MVKVYKLKAQGKVQGIEYRAYSVDSNNLHVFQVGKAQQRKTIQGVKVEPIRVLAL